MKTRTQSNYASYCYYQSDLIFYCIQYSRKFKINHNYYLNYSHTI